VHMETIAEAILAGRRAMDTPPQGER
jgi:hypothetical protein